MSEKRQAIQYYQTLGVRLHDFQLMGTDDVSTQGLPWGLRANFVHLPTGNRYQSVWVYTQHRGKGLMSGYVNTTKIPFITQPRCGIVDWFVARGVPVLTIADTK